MATGNLAATGGVADIQGLLNLIQNFTGQSGTNNTRTGTTQNTSGSQNTSGTTTGTSSLTGNTSNNTSSAGTSNQSSTLGGTTTQTGGSRNVQTTRSDITAEGINKMLQDILAGDQGIAQIAMGERSSGAYNSTSRQFLTNDLLSRTAGELARLQAGTTTVTEGSNNQSTQSTQTQNVIGSNTQNQVQTGTQSQNTSQVGTSNQATTSNQQMNSDVQSENVRTADPALDPTRILGLIAGGTIGGSALGTLLPALGYNDGIGGLLRSVGSQGGTAVADLLRPLLPGNSSGFDINNIFRDLDDNDMNWLEDLLTNDGGSGSLDNFLDVGTSGD